MTHYTLEDWADFARERTPREAAGAMQQHLDSGCAVCSKVLQMWMGVLEVARRERDFDVPEPGVRCVKALFNIAGPERAEGLPVRYTRLLFNSLAEPCRAGIRGVEASTYHWLFEEGNWLLDLHVKPLPDDSHVSIAGQILERMESEPGYEGHEVAVMHDKVQLARTITNEFGEFQLEVPVGGELLIMVRLKGKSILVSRLPEHPATRRSLRESP